MVVVVIVVVVIVVIVVIVIVVVVIIGCAPCYQSLLDGPLWVQQLSVLPYRIKANR